MQTIKYDASFYSILEFLLWWTKLSWKISVLSILIEIFILSFGPQTKSSRTEFRSLFSQFDKFVEIKTHPEANPKNPWFFIAFPHIKIATMKTWNSSSTIPENFLNSSSSIPNQNLSECQAQTTVSILHVSNIYIIICDAFAFDSFQIPSSTF